MPDPASPPDPVAPAAPSGSSSAAVSTPSEPEGVGFTLDGRQLRAKKGELIIAAAERAGTYIPRFCYHPRMKPVGMCRMCLVEIIGPRGSALSPACYLPVTEGMQVVSDSPKVKKAQDGVLEFLLINHPLDCPVCDKGGECPLQDQTIAYRPGETRFVEEKRHWDKPTPLSSLVLIDRERCIQCARCTRFAEEVAGDPAIDFASRSDSSEVAVYPGQPFVSNFSGNVVQICPVGALLAKPYRFKARPWDLEQVETTCTFCAVGCRVAAQSSSDQVVRFLGVDSDPVNWGWLCDKGRFCFEALNSPDRLAHPLLRKAGGGAPVSKNGGSPDGLVQASWSEAFAEIVSRLADVRGDRIGIIGGARLPNEDAYAWAKLARTVLRTDNVDAQLGDGLPAELVASLPRATIDQACAAPLVLTMAPDIKEELPVLYLRLRHAAVEDGVQVIELSSVPTGLSSVASQRLRYRPGDLVALARSLSGGTPVTEAVGGVPAEVAERARAAIAAAASTGNPAPRIVVIIGRPSLAELAEDVAEAALQLARLPGVAFLPALRRANVHGAIDLGLAPGLLPGRTSLEAGREWYERKWEAPLPRENGLGTLGMLKRAANGQMDVLFLLGADPIADCPDKDLAVRGLKRARFVVAVDAFSTASTARADVVLPAAIYTERRGSFTNIEGRITWLGQKVTAPGSARPDWMIAVELASRLGGNLGVTSLAELWAEIEVVSPLHQGVSQALLVSRQARNGVVVPLELETARPEPEVPSPLDPMADPGIASAEIHPVPAVRRSVRGVGVGRGNAPGTGEEDLQAVELSPLNPPPRLQPRAPATAPVPTPAKGEGPNEQSSQAPLRLVATRPMWDGGAFVQHSPSVASLYPPLELRANPDDLGRLGVAHASRVRVSAKGKQASVVVTAIGDSRVPMGTVVLPFNLPGDGAGLLIDASAAVTEISVEKLEG